MSCRMYISLWDLNIGGNITASGALTIDTINENTPSNGVVIESVTLKDGNITATSIIGDVTGTVYIYSK